MVQTCFLYGMHATKNCLVKKPLLGLFNKANINDVLHYKNLPCLKFRTLWGFGVNFIYSFVVFKATVKDNMTMEDKS